MATYSLLSGPPLFLLLYSHSLSAPGVTPTSTPTPTPYDSRLWRHTERERVEGTLDWQPACTLSGYFERPVLSVDWSHKSGLIAAGGEDDRVTVRASKW
jgi:hypothetical protein